VILGLDISTSCTGWCLIDSIDSKLLKIGYIDLGKEKNFLAKAEIVKRELVSISQENDIKEIFIEENLQAFRPGFSSAKTLMTLARFNGIISYICVRDLKFEPQFINVNIARKNLGLKIDRKSKLTTKEQIFEWVKNRVEIDWPVKVLKSGPRKGVTVQSPGCYDMADAYVIASAGFKIAKESKKIKTM
jgi:hypothetical protein|tara:strand:- start:928 stop:1494 length:567 start_codon:yes stop_codon:yes gene_type:complete